MLEASSLPEGNTFVPTQFLRCPSATGRITATSKWASCAPAPGAETGVWANTGAHWAAARTPTQKTPRYTTPTRSSIAALQLFREHQHTAAPAEISVKLHRLQPGMPSAPPQKLLRIRPQP